MALTEFLLSDRTSFELPRKFKLAFSGCGRDCASATVSDAGFIAKRRNRTDGFSVYVGGGLGARSRVADLLEDFAPADQAHLVAEAIKRVFSRHGERKNRRQARLRFLIERIGIDQFRDLYEKELAELKNQSVQCPALRQIVPAKNGKQQESGGGQAGESFDLWREKNVVPQKQNGYYLVKIPLALGDLDCQTMLALADMVESYGEGMLRLTIRQNAVIRWVGEGKLGQVYQRLEAIGLAWTGSALCDNIVSCTGAATCRLGICLSRGLKGAIVEELTKSGLDLDKFPELDINISGCPNACGRHPMGQIGLYGAARRVGDRLVPYYIVQLGGKLAEGQTSLAGGKIAIPARNVPAFLVDFLKSFRDSLQYPDFDGFLAAGNERVAEQLAGAYKQVPDFQSDKNYYYAWGSETLFSLADRSESECEGVSQPVQESVRADADQAADRMLDCRGVACPLNYVKTLAVLEQMEAGESLSVLLDQDGASNVPKSVVLDGHEVLATSRTGEHWRVVIRKK